MSWLPGALAVIWLLTLSLVALIQWFEFRRLQRSHQELEHMLMAPTITTVRDPTQLEVL